MDWLTHRCRRLLWLNPLLRFEGFEARPAGIRAMLPHVDRFLPVHNLESLHDLAAVLAGPQSRRAEARGGRPTAAPVPSAPLRPPLPRGATLQRDAFRPHSH